MAQPQAPTTLLLQPKYVVTRYNRVLLYGAGILCTIIGLSWVFVMATRSTPSTWESQVRLVSSAQPLVLPEKPTPPPPPLSEVGLLRGKRHIVYHSEFGFSHLGV